jgi:hypothetical protein
MLWPARAKEASERLPEVQGGLESRSVPVSHSAPQHEAELTAVITQ